MSALDALQLQGVSVNTATKPLGIDTLFSEGVARDDAGAYGKIAAERLLASR